MIKFFVVKKLKLRKPASGKRQDVANAAVARCDGAVSGRGGTLNGTFDGEGAKRKETSKGRQQKWRSGQND